MNFLIGMRSGIGNVLEILVGDVQAAKQEVITVEIMDWSVLTWLEGMRAAPDLDIFFSTCWWHGDIDMSRVLGIHTAFLRETQHGKDLRIVKQFVCPCGRL